MIILPESHLDHGISTTIAEWLMGQFEDRADFFVETVEIPEKYGTVPCGLYGPAMGDGPTAFNRGRIYTRTRPGRDWPSRLVPMPTRQTRKVTVIAGPTEVEEPCPATHTEGTACEKCNGTKMVAQIALYTVYGGPAAPREPGDPSLTTPEEKAEAEAFWSQHALANGLA